MDFAHYAEAAVDLVNADLSDATTLGDHLIGRDWVAANMSPSDLVPLRRLQADLSGVVDASAAGAEAEVVEGLNDLLARHPIRPRISGHDASTWHLHVSERGASVAGILTAESLLGLTLLVTEVGADRLGRCAADGCNRAFVDTSTNHSRRFCSSRCSTRTNVANYRQRRRQDEPDPPAP